MITEVQIKEQYGEILQELAESLDLTDTQVKEAEERYKAVGEYLSRENSSLAQLNPSIEPQGSFLYGTMTRPIHEDGHYDIDLICILENLPVWSTQKDLKLKVGNELKVGRYESMLDEEGQRCWTLNYAEGTRFHMDILPAVHDMNSANVYEGKVDRSLYQYALRMTDKKSDTYDSSNRYDWPKTNPKGYAAWFKRRMETQFLAMRKMVAESFQMKIEDVPDWRVKTPLQRAIQILKRHRDIMFEEHDDKPISIIITTLAAKAYNQEANVYEALVSILNGMEDYITYKYKNGKMVDWIENPVNPEENFADKWEDYPSRKKAFKAWIQKAKDEILGALEQRGLHNIQKSLEPSFGKKVVVEAFENLGHKSRLARETGTKKMAQSTGTLGVLGRAIVKDKDNFGSWTDE